MNIILRLQFLWQTCHTKRFKWTGDVVKMNCGRGYLYQIHPSFVKICEYHSSNLETYCVCVGGGGEGLNYNTIMHDYEPTPKFQACTQ